jgi:hypothetical protein
VQVTDDTGEAGLDWCCLLRHGRFRNGRRGSERLGTNRGRSYRIGRIGKDWCDGHGQDNNGLWGTERTGAEWQEGKGRKVSGEDW